jgi:hypothetical protein
MQIQPHDDSRLDREEEFAVRSEEAQEMLPKEASLANLKDFSDRVGHPFTRADTIRRFHPDRSPAQGLDGREREIMAAFTRHPRALTEHEHLTEPVVDEDVQERIDDLLDPSTGDLSTEDLSFLLDDDELGRSREPRKVQIGSRTFYSSPKSPAQSGVRRWETEKGKAMLALKLQHHLRRVAREMGDKPRERSMAQHIDELGLSTLFEASPYFEAQ